MRQTVRMIIAQTFRIGIAAALLCGFIAAQKSTEPLSAEAYYNRGLAQKKAARFDEALQSFTKALERNPRDARVYKERGECLTGARNAEALADLNKAIRLKSDFVEAYTARGNVYFDLFLKGNPTKEKAFTDFNKAVELNPRCAGCYYARAKLWFWARDTGERLFADLGKAIELDPLNKAYLTWRAALYQLTDDYQKSISDCNALLKNDPQDADALLLRGQNYYSVGEYQKAIDDFTRGIEVKPIVSLVFLQNRAKAYRSLGKIAEAEADERKFKPTQ